VTRLLACTNVGENRMGPLRLHLNQARQLLSLTTVQRSSDRFQLKKRKTPRAVMKVRSVVCSNCLARCVDDRCLQPDAPSR
jgi:hypothetical protein